MRKNWKALESLSRFLSLKRSETPRGDEMKTKRAPERARVRLDVG